MRRRSIVHPLAALAMLALAPAVFAGGWAKVTATNVPTDPPAGEPTTINLDVLQHGVTPVSWPDLTVVATDAASGTVIRTAAEPKGPTGSYVATLVFPNEGEWALTFESSELIMDGSVALRVTPPVAASPAQAPPSRAVDLLPVLLALIALGATLLVGGLALRGRSAAPEAPVSAGT